MGSVTMVVMTFVVLLITGITLLLGMVLPLLLSNTIAVIAATLYAWYLIEVANGLQPESITIEIG
jgi:hypothetical protein